MCGICGIWNYAAQEPVDRGLLRRMTDTMIHRGPDDAGFHFDDTAGLGFGFRRLAIIDLTPTGHQPMSNEDGSVWVMLNGEIYNFRGLRESLAKRGHLFRSTSDAEVLAHQYEESGPDCVREFNGMFGLAVWDGPRRRLTLARDRIGKKPLYYLDDGRRIVFASELKAILEDRSVPRRLDADALAEYLRVGYVGSPRTIFKDIRKLEPGHVLARTASASRGQRYWDWLPDFQPDASLSEPEWTERIRATVSECVRTRLISDVPLGAFLSGGTDSSFVVAAMARIGDKPVKTFSIGFENQQFNELPYAREVAARFGTEHHEYIVKPESLSEILPKLARQFDEPFADSSALPTYYVSKMARQEVTVCLSGDGGDETMAGYPHYALSAKESFIPRLPDISRLIPPFVRGHRYFRRMAQAPLGRYACLMQIAYETQVRSLLAHDVRGSLAGEGIRLERVLRGALPPDFVSAMQYADARAYLPEDILTKVDRTSMLNSLETRSPLLDYRFFKLAASMPAALRLRSGETKHIFKKAMRGLVPDSVLDRPKMGFSIPAQAWLAGDARDFVREVLSPESIRRRGLFEPGAIGVLLRQRQEFRPTTWPLVWSLLFFELWAGVYLDGK